MALRGLLESLKRKKWSVADAPNKPDVWHTFPMVSGVWRDCERQNTYHQDAQR